MENLNSYKQHEITYFDVQYDQYGLCTGNIFWYLKNKFGENFPIYDINYQNDTINLYCELPKSHYHCHIDVVTVAHDEAYHVSMYQDDNNAIHDNIISETSLYLETAFEKALGQVPSIQYPEPEHLPF